MAGGDSLAAEAAHGEDLSLMPPQIKEIMIRLQSENKLLKEQQERDLNRSTLDKADLHEQIESLTNEKQSLSDKINALEAKILSGTSEGEMHEGEIHELQDRLQKQKIDEQSKKEEIEQLNANLNDAKQKGEEFEALLRQKEEDIKVLFILFQSFFRYFCVFFSLEIWKFL